MRLAALTSTVRVAPFAVALPLLAVLLVAMPASAGDNLAVTTTSPATGQTVSGKITWEVSVASNSVDHVDFAVDGSVRWTAHNFPWTFGGPGGTLDTTTLSSGGHQLSATAYGKNGKSSSSSTVTITVANSAPPVPVAPPGISGTTTVGSTLAASTGTWSGSVPMTYVYQWSRCNSSGGSCASLSGASGASYTLTPSDAGATFRVSVTATNSVGSATATSPPTAAVGSSTPTATTTSGGTTTASTTASTTTTTTTSSPSPGLGSKLPARMPPSSGTQTLIASSSGSGTSCTVLAPCTLSQAWSTATSGTIIEVRAGNYGLLDVEHRRYDPSNPVTMRSYPGETAVFAGASASPSLNAVVFVDCRGIRIESVVIDAPYNVSDLKIETSQHVEVNNIIVRNAGIDNSVGGNGILVGSNPGYTEPYSDDIQIWNSVVYNWGLNTTPGWNGKHGIYYGSHGAQNGVIANNVIYDGPAGYGLQLGGDASNTIVTNNTFVHMYRPDNGVGSSIVVWNDGYNLGTNDNIIVNNILTNNVAYGVQGSGNTSSGNVVRNNLTYADEKGAYLPVYGSNTIFSVESPISADPRFVNYTGHDFHLQSGSPALGAADPAYSPRYDHDGNARSASPALGAFG